MMWMHNVRTDARTVGLGGEGRRVVKNGLKIFSYFGGDCPAVVVCCGRGFSSASMREIISMPAQYLAHRLARIFVQVHDLLPRERPLLFFRVFAADLLPPPYLPRKRPFLSVFSPVAAAFGCISDPVLFFLGIFAY